MFWNAGGTLFYHTNDKFYYAFYQIYHKLSISPFELFFLAPRVSEEFWLISCEIVDDDSGISKST